MNLNEQQIERYSRHIILQNVGSKGQKKLLQAKVLIIGVGGLGSAVSLYLAAAGVGNIGIIDDDVVDLSNLQRQVIHFTTDLDKPKVESAAEKIKMLNPDVNVTSLNKLIDPDNIMDIIKDYDFIVDGTDNFPTKFMINDACVLSKKPFSHAGILNFTGQSMTYTPGNACYRCVYAEPPPKNAVPSCSQAGVLGSVAGMLGTIQATETLKSIIGKGDLLTNRMMIFDAYAMQFREVQLSQNPNCPVCGKNPEIIKPTLSEHSSCDMKQ